MNSVVVYYCHILFIKHKENNNEHLLNLIMKNRQW